MKTKIALISTGALLSAGVAMHITNHCPLHELKAAEAKTAPAPAPVNTEAKPATVVLR